MTAPPEARPADVEASEVVRPGPDPLALAEEAVQRVQATPAAAAELAAQALAAGDDPEVVSVAQRALGLAARERGDLRAALAHLQRAVAVAERAGLPQRAGQARTSLSLALAYAGRTAAALQEADRAAAVLVGPDAARLQMQRALVLQRLGRTEEALEGYRRALAGFRRSGDLLWEARLRSNRGALHTYRGALTAAEHDLDRAERLADRLGQDLLLAHVRHNRGFLAARRGDVPAALAAYDRAEQHYRAHGGQLAMLLLDRAELLTSVRLLDEALQASHEAVGLLAGAGVATDLAEGRLTLAAAALLSGDPDRAVEQARSAARELGRQRRPVWALLARSLEVRARAGRGERSAALLHRARAVAHGLDEAGLAAEAAGVRLVAGTLALALGRADDAQQELRRAAASRSRGPAEVRARGWHAAALLRLADGDRGGALRALGCGLQVLHEARAALGATELRTHAAGAGDDLARLGTSLALTTRRARTVLTWAERCRATGLRHPPARPPDDAELAEDLAALRRASAEVDALALEQRDPAPALARQARLERAVQARTRTARAEVGPRDVDDRIADVLPALGDRALLELVREGDDLWAVTATRDRACLRRLAPAAAVTTELAALRFALRRLAVGHGTPSSLAALRTGAATAAQRLDGLLLAPVRRLLDARPLVVVPTGEAHALPWALLPSLAGRAVTVAPSAVVWHRAACRPAAPPAAAPLLVAGPGLEHAEREVQGVAPHLPGARVLTGSAATAAAVLDGLEGAPLAHLAAHGRFRADNPQFSCLRLADGPVTVHDLEGLRVPPDLLVLSACDSGLSAVAPGDELSGLVAALLAVGTRSVVASVAPVDDLSTRLLMEELHARLALGEPPAVALAGAQSALVDDGLPRHAVAAFACSGAG